MQSFIVSTSNSGLGILASAFFYITIVLSAVFVILLALKLMKKSQVRVQWLAVLAICVVSMFAPWALLHSSTGNYSFEIGNGYVSMNAPFIGNHTYTSSDMKYAFVENLNSGNITLGTRNDGTSIGSINEGHFTTNTGATAYVISNNATNLVILLNSGTYIILGTNNTNQMASYFSSNVMPVS